MILKRFVLSFIVSLSLIVNPLLAGQFVCSTDPAYIDYKKGNSLNLDSATKYAGESICENNCRDYDTCQKDTNNTYFCPTRKYENLGGNANGGSNFTNRSACNSKCYFQNSCVELKPNPCKPADIEYANPVTDYTGKTIYTRRTITYECTNSETKLVGCNKWKITTNNGSFDYNISNVGSIYKSRTKTNEAQNLMAMLEQQLHIFSGWNAYCDHGIMFNNPFSNPMAILSYAMMIYSAAGANSLKGTEIKNLHDDVKNAFDSATKPISDAYDKFKTSIGLGETPESLSKKALSLKDTNVVYKQPSLLNQFNNMNKITTLVPKDSVSMFSNDIDLLWTDVAKAAMLLTPTKDEVQQADYFNKAWMGDSDADEHSLAYANCMASIGLSMPNLVSAYAADINNTSPELKNFWENPIRLTPQQLSTLIAATSEKYARQAYVEYDYDSDKQMLTLIAKNQSAYYQAGQVICGGKLAISQNILQQKAVNSGDSKGIGSGVVVGLGKMALTKIATAIGGPITGLVTSLLIDIVTSLQSGNACTDKDIAAQWGLIQLKTNRFLNFDQCHFIKSTCAAKWFWGSCMRHRNNYCCYDQISTRIFAEGIKEEMYPPNDPKMWASCKDVTINDLKNISFRKCLEDEQPYRDHCFPADKYKEFEDAIRNSGVVNFDFQGAANQAINSLAIPNKVCKIK